MPMLRRGHVLRYTFICMMHHGSNLTNRISIPCQPSSCFCCSASWCCLSQKTALSSGISSSRMAGYFRLWETNAITAQYQIPWGLLSVSYGQTWSGASCLQYCTALPSHPKLLRSSGLLLWREIPWRYISLWLLKVLLLNGTGRWPVLPPDANPLLLTNKCMPHLWIRSRCSEMLWAICWHQQSLWKGSCRLSYGSQGRSWPYHGKTFSEVQNHPRRPFLQNLYSQWTAFF